MAHDARVRGARRGALTADADHCLRDKACDAGVDVWSHTAMVKDMEAHVAVLLRQRTTVLNLATRHRMADPAVVTDTQLHVRAQGQSCVPAPHLGAQALANRGLCTQFVTFDDNREASKPMARGHSQGRFELEHAGRGILTRETAGFTVASMLRLKHTQAVQDASGIGWWLRSVWRLHLHSQVCAGRLFGTHIDTLLAGARVLLHWLSERRERVSAASAHKTKPSQAKPTSQANQTSKQRSGSNSVRNRNRCSN